MSGPSYGAGSNPLAGGSSANAPATNPLAGGSPNPNTGPAGAPAGGPSGSNPLAGGSSGDPQNPPNPNDPNGDPNAPISRDVYNERVRAEQALRKRVQELEQYRTAQEDAKLTQEQLNAKRLADIEAERVAWQQERRGLVLQRVVDDRVRERGLVDANAVRAILMAEYADQIDYDEQGNPTNAPYLIDRAVEKYPFLLTPPTTPQQPGTGRQVSPPRNPSNGQYTQPQYGQPGARQQAQQQPVPPSQWPHLGDIDWSKPGGQ